MVLKHHFLLSSNSVCKIFGAACRSSERKSLNTTPTSSITQQKPKSDVKYHLRNKNSTDLYSFMFRDDVWKYSLSQYGVCLQMKMICVSCFLICTNLPQIVCLKKSVYKWCITQIFRNCLLYCFILYMVADETRASSGNPCEHPNWATIPVFKQINPNVSFLIYDFWRPPHNLLFLFLFRRTNEGTISKN